MAFNQPGTCYRSCWCYSVLEGTKQIWMMSLHMSKRKFVLQSEVSKSSWKLGWPCWKNKSEESSNTSHCCTCFMVLISMSLEHIKVQMWNGKPDDKPSILDGYAARGSHHFVGNYFHDLVILEQTTNTDSVSLFWYENDKGRGINNILIAKPSPPHRITTLWYAEYTTRWYHN